MEVIHPRCAGVDVSKKDAKVCIRIQGGGRRKTTSTVGTWSSMAGSVLELREYLIGQEVLSVALFDDEAATGFEDESGMETPRRVFPGGAFMVIAAAWSLPLPGAATH